MQFPDLILKARHVIVSADSEARVRAVLAMLPAKEGVKVKCWCVDEVSVSLD